MNKALRIGLMLPILTWMGVSSTIAQQINTFAGLKDEIVRLQRVVSSASTPASMKAAELKLLAEKKIQLRASLQSQIGALRRYQETYQSRFSVKETRNVKDLIRSLEGELRNLEESTSGQSAPLQSAVRPAPPRATASLAATADVSRSQPRNVRAAREVSRVNSAAQSAAQAFDCQLCDLPDEVLVLDASTGKTYWHDSHSTPIDDDKKTRFGKGERVRVIVINKNPFLYKYNINVQETVVVEDALAPFLKTLSPVFGAVVGAAGAGNDIFLNDLTIPASCPADKAANARLAYQSLREDVQNLSTRLDSVILSNPDSDLLTLKAKFDPVSLKFNAANKVFARTRSTGGTMLCTDLCNTANAIQGTLNAYTPDNDFKSLQTKLDDLKTQADAINAKITDFLASFPDCQPRESGSSTLRLLQNRLQTTFKDKLTAALNDLNQMRESYKEFVKMRDNLNLLATRPDLLRDEKTIGPFNDPTNVVVKVEFKGLAAPDAEAFKPAAEAKLNFGGDKRFALSAGVAYGFLERPEYKPILGFERDAQGNTVPGQTAPVSVIGVSDNTKRRIGPMLLLNTRLTNNRDTNLFFSVGITGTADNTGLNIDYLFGPSVNILDRKVFLTYGVYGGRVQRLNEGLYLGLKVPDATTPEKLVNKDFVWKTGFAVTYKVK